MATYNIYDYDNKVELGEPTTVVVLNDNDTEIISITSSDPERQEDDESIIRDYIGYGATALDALNLFAGAYGQVWNADNVGQAGGKPEEVSVTEDDAVISAAGDEVAPVAEEQTPAISDGSDQVMSGAIMAMADDQGTVVTLFQAGEDGSGSIRLDGAWKPLADLGAIENLSFVGVSASAVETYDKYQAEGNLIGIKFYTPSAEGPYWHGLVESDESETAPEEDVVEEDTAEEEEAVTAALTLDGPLDLDNAISAALLNSDLRWFVERRVAALGLEAQLPWQKD